MGPDRQDLHGPEHGHLLWPAVHPVSHHVPGYLVPVLFVHPQGEFLMEQNEENCAATCMRCFFMRQPMNDMYLSLPDLLYSHSCLGTPICLSTSLQQPHYNEWVNHIRSGLYCMLFWTSVFIAIMKFDHRRVGAYALIAVFVRA